jgi:hypothetical protein
VTPARPRAAYVSTRRVRFLPQVAGVQKRGPPLVYTARSGVESQQDDAGICAELVLVRVSKAAHPREQEPCGCAGAAA